MVYFHLFSINYLSSTVLAARPAANLFVRQPLKPSQAARASTWRSTRASTQYIGINFHVIGPTFRLQRLVFHCFSIHRAYFGT